MYKKTIGKLNVYVEHAILSYDACTVLTMHPYFNIHISPYKCFKSKKRTNGGKCAIFKENFEFIVEDEETLTLRLLHEDIMVKIKFNLIDRSSKYSH